MKYFLMALVPIYILFGIFWKRMMDRVQPPEPPDPPPELRYCPKCNQRRYFTDGQCEMCLVQKHYEEHKRIVENDEKFMARIRK